MNEKPLRVVLWSGGLDSTYLIQKSLGDGYQVIAYYVEIKNNPTKTMIELAAIEKMLPIFKCYDFKYMGKSCSVEVHDYGHNLIFQQAPIWIFSLLRCLQDVKFNYEISLGYVMNDDAISYLNDFKSLWKAHSFFITQNFPKLTFPLSKFPKYTIFDGLWDELKPLVWSCENPRIKKNKTSSIMLNSSKKYTAEDYEQCGMCNSCKHSPIINLSKNTKYDTIEPMIKLVKMDDSMLDNQLQFNYDIVNKPIDAVENCVINGAE